MPEELEHEQEDLIDLIAYQRFMALQFNVYI